ncbi:asparagine synthetase B family protein [Kitasatospora aureofaciens]|uniref:asparagine synthetase B family protein n=1 Tax=Kitasatospora aureofaciens TaxID=1894 RepID=UPI001C474EAB|nr:asparagine synthetase B family protein [Kitasatospora aureofaciens]MBV6701800.1 asparagine synthetase B family protein [Kitasatospora aureofaciens]
MGGEIRVRGCPTVALGHPLPRPGGVEGVFAHWAWDGTGVTAGTDRYGMLPLFYWADEEHLVLSPELGDVLALGAPRHWDDDALAVFLRLGYFVGDDTPFAAIRVLPPGGVLTWSPGTPPRGRARPPVTPPSPGITRPQAVDAYIDLFRSAIAARLPSAPYVLPLSGGRDSRHILLELLRQQAPPQLAVTTGKFTPHDADVRVAGRLAAAAGVPHRYIDRARSDLRADLTTNRLQQMCTTEGGWVLPLGRFLRTRTPLTYDGLAGDSLSQDPHVHFRPIHDRRRLGTATGLADWLIEATGLAPLLPHLLDSTRLRRWSHERALTRLAAETARHLDAAFPLRSFVFWNRTRRAIALHPIRVIGDGGVPVHLPYLDHALFDLLMALPEQVLGDSCLRTEAISRAYPRYTQLPYAEGPMRHGPRVALARTRYLGDLLRHAADPRRAWWRGHDGMLPHLLRGAGRGPRFHAIDRMAPYAVYLIQLAELTAAPAPTGPPSSR